MTERTIIGVPGEEVINWMSSWLTAFPLPTPVAREITLGVRPCRHHPHPPLPTAFQDRLDIRDGCGEDLSNGRFIERPLRHRRPRPRFTNKLAERLARTDFELWLTQRDRPLRDRLFQQRKARRYREKTFWWGRFARMRPSDVQAYSSWHPKRIRQDDRENKN